jgi:copper/silver efflux system protein
MKDTRITDPPAGLVSRLIRFSLQNRLLVGLVFGGLVLWGVAVAPFDWDTDWLPRDPIGVDAIPDLGENQQIVFTEWGGRSPRDVEDQVTYPLTVQLMGLPGVREVRSTSMFGFSSIFVIFDDDVEFYWSRSRILEKLNSLPPGTLPADVQPGLGPDATGLGQIFWYTLEGRDPDGRPAGGWDLHEIRSVQDYFVRYGLLSTEGIAEVASVGGFVQEYQVDVDPDAMRAAGVSLEEVFDAVRGSNLDIGARTTEINRVEYIVRGVGFVQEVSDIESSVVRTGAGHVPIHVRDIANVTLGPADRRGILDRGGAEAVGGVVVVRQGYNPLEAINNVRAKIEELEVGMPSRAVIDWRRASMTDVEAYGWDQAFDAFHGAAVNHQDWLRHLRSTPRAEWPEWVTTSQLTIEPFYDRSGLIHETLGTLNDALYQQILVTILVVLLLLMHLRVSLVVSLMLPLAVLMTFVGMKLFGVDANVVALAGIAIAIGTIVDMGIIVSENVTRHLREAPPSERRIDVVYRGASEVGSAVLTAISTTVISFLPVFMMTGAEGKLFLPLAYTKTFVLIAAVLIALTLVPVVLYLAVARWRGGGDAWRNGRLGTILVRRGVLTGLAAAGMVIFVYSLFVGWLVAAGAGLVLAMAAGLRLYTATVGTRLALSAPEAGADERTGQALSLQESDSRTRPSGTETGNARTGQALSEAGRHSSPRTGQALSDEGRHSSPRTGQALSLLAGFFVTWVLASVWEPLGPERGFFLNLVFVVMLVGGVVGLFMLFERRYERILRWALANKRTFLAVPVVLVFLGLNVWLGFDRIFGFAPNAAEAVGVKGMRASAPYSWAAHTFPGLGREFMPPLNEGSFLWMPTTMPHASIGEARDIMGAQNMAFDAIPEVSSVVGKLGRAESALDPAPISMFETVINYRPEYRQDAAGRRINFAFDRRSGEFVRDEVGELIPDRRGRPYRQWREHIRSERDIWDEIVRAGRMPGITGAPRLQPIETRLVMLQTGMRAPMGIKVSGPDLETVGETALQIESLLREIPAVESATVNAERVVGKPYLEVHIDREQAARYGLRVADIQETLAMAVGGMAATTTVEGRERYQVRVRYPRELRQDPDAIARVLVPARGSGGGLMQTAGGADGGAVVPLGDVAEIRYVRGPEMIRSENTFPVAYVTFGGAPGMAEVDVVESAQRYLNDLRAEGRLQLPAGVTYTFAGSYQNQLRAAKTLRVVLPLSLALIFLILFFQFRSVPRTLIVFSGIAVAWAGGFVMIWLYSQGWFADFPVFGVNMRELFQLHAINLSVAVWVGFLALFGIAVDDGVVMTTYLKQSFEASEPDSVEAVREATVAAGLRRVKPLLMTSATTILALLPVLTSTGRGADLMIPMAIPSVGGMSLVLLTMFTVPVLFCWLEERRLRRISKSEG